MPKLLIGQKRVQIGQKYQHWIQPLEGMKGMFWEMKILEKDANLMTIN